MMSLRYPLVPEWALQASRDGVFAFMRASFLIAVNLACAS